MVCSSYALIVSFVFGTTAQKLPASNQTTPTTEKTTREIAFKTHDGFDLNGKLTMPTSKGKHAVVIYVQTAEGMTVDMKRPLGQNKTFNYFDLYREKLPPMGVGFFSYEGRGITMGESLPRFEKIDQAIYNTSTLDNKVRDAMEAVKLVRRQSGVDPKKVFLMGASEGTLLAADTASRMPKEVAGLILYGVMAKNMKETFAYIMSEGGYMTFHESFNTDGDDKVSKAEFEADVWKYREQRFKDAPFSIFDKNGDGFFTVDEMKLLTQIYHDAIREDNFAVLDAWTKVGAAVATPDHWFKDHFRYAPIWTFLSKVDMPVGCFQGDRDASCPIAGVKDLEATAKKARKKKMEFYYFKGLDHSLHIGLYFVKGELPAGHKAIFEFIERISKKQDEALSGLCSKRLSGTTHIRATRT